MFVYVNQKEFNHYNENNTLTFISLWDDIQLAKQYYDKKNGLYTGIKCTNPNSAHATPIHIYKFRHLNFIQVTTRWKLPIS